MPLSNLIDYAFASFAYFASKFLRMTANASLTPLEKRSALSPLVYRILGANPGPFTLQGTNTYLIGSGRERILLDTGESNITEYVQSLRKTLEDLGNIQIVSIICTHWHHDHVGGVENVLTEVLENDVQIPVHKFPRGDRDEIGFKFIQDGHKFHVEGATLRAIHSPGHTTDHIVLKLEEENAIFSGDCILGEGTAVFEDLHSYMQSLNKLLGLKPSRIYPGHGPVVDNPIDRIEHYIHHRNEREKQIVNYLQTQTGNVSSMDIVNAVYVGISVAVKLGALNNVKHHLSKLVKDGKVSEELPDRWRIAVRCQM